MKKTEHPQKWHGCRKSEGMVINGIAVEGKIQFRSKSMVCYEQYHKIAATREQWQQMDEHHENGQITRFLTEFRQSAKFRANVEKLKKTAKYTGEITAGAKKRLAKAVSLLVQSAPEKWIWNPVTKKNQHHKLSFITLTLPDVEAAKDAKFTHKHLLQPMLRILREKYKMKAYVWKAELQKNESIHYHITTELFLPWEQLRQHWNALMKKNSLLEKFAEKYGHENPNSVDIHAVNKINDLEAYLIKYVTKEYQNGTKLQGKIWDCSKNLKEAKYFTTNLDSEIHQQLLSEIDLGWLEPIYRDRCVILRSRTTDYYQSFSQRITNDYYSHLNSILAWESDKTSATSKSISKFSSVSSTSGQRREHSEKRLGNESLRTLSRQLALFKTTIYGQQQSEK